MSIEEQASSAPDPLLGKVLSERYRIISKLGEGGMGVVYLAEHVVIEKRVALKVLSPEFARRQDLVARFLQEAKSASRIGHQNVIDISDFGQSPEGFVYFAMEFLDGEDLSHALKRSPGGIMTWERSRPILLQICRALRAAHNRGIVHRDMKPENVYLIEREGQPDFVKVLDFGIAKVTGLSDDAQRLTRTGMIFGTPDYMSPEQAQGQRLDHRVDVYAVGCMMYHMLTGEPPFKAESFMGILSKHMFEAPVPPSQRRPDAGITPELDAVALRAMEKDREKRYADMGAMAEAVAAAGGGRVADMSTQRLATLEMGSAGTPPPVTVGAGPTTAPRNPIVSAPGMQTQLLGQGAPAPTPVPRAAPESSIGQEEHTAPMALAAPAAATPGKSGALKVALVVAGAVAAGIGLLMAMNNKAPEAPAVAPAPPALAAPAVTAPAPASPPAPAAAAPAPSEPPAAAAPAATPTPEPSAPPAPEPPAAAQAKEKGGHKAKGKGKSKPGYEPPPIPVPAFPKEAPKAVTPAAPPGAPPPSRPNTPKELKNPF